MHNKCSCEYSTGSTHIECCNICGLPLQKENWHFFLPDEESNQVQAGVMQKPVGGWISVDEKLPTEGQDVLVYNSFGHIIVAYYWKGIWSDTIPKPSTYYFTVSKWMPLPEPSES